MGTVRNVVGEVIGGRYELEELIGTGGMSSVYRARDSLLERHVALKVLHSHYAEDEDFVERFRREARAVAQLSHPNIVTVIDRGEDGGRQFIVFEHVAGENLKELLVRCGALPVREALQVALQIARALAFAHEQGLVHRDVKPQNVLLNGDGRAKVTDFGIARSLDVAGVTQTGTVLGTSDYIAPEQAGGQPVNAQTDVYSLGVVLFELLTGEVPFPGESFVAVAMKHVHEPPPRILDRRGDVPPRVAAAVERALEKDPDRRFPSMDAFAAELEACLAELTRPPDEGVTMVVPPRAAAAPVQAVAARSPRRRRRAWPLIVAVVAVAALAGGVAALLATRPTGLVGESGGAAPSRPIHLAGVGSFDPYGDDKDEHSELARDATDGNQSTYWRTQIYDSFTKPGVGLVLDAGRPVAARSVTVSSETPGFTAQIRGGSSASGPFAPLSGKQTVDGTTSYELNGKKRVRYLVVWITALPGGFARINEVRAR
jgi:serine/threonine protein kinase